MTVAVVEKIFLLLETLARADHALPLKQLAESTELPKPTAHRLLQTLQTLGYVVRDGDSTNYLLGHRIQELARGPIHQRIKEAAAPLMQKLHKALNETVNLGVREGLLIRYVDYLETSRPLRLIVRPGQTDPLFTTALGRAILSAHSDDEVQRSVADLRREAGGPNHIEGSKIQQVLATARKRGWAEEEEETVKGVSCLAISLRRLGYPNAAVSVSVPTVRCNKACLHTIETIFKEFYDAGI
jgi:IclR family transcriptional regulator, KDG regulon repressor